MEPEIHPFEQEKTSFHQTSEAWGSICQISPAWNLLTVPKMCKLPPGRFKHFNGSGWSILVFSIFFSDALNCYDYVVNGETPGQELEVQTDMTLFTDILN